jgi:sporulation protein YlmC with PRC-barrel domain
MINTEQIKPDMPVVCSQDGQFATVDHMEGTNTIKLKKDKTGQHHYIPVSWVTSTEGGKVKVDRPGDQAMEEWSTSPPNMSYEDRDTYGIYQGRLNKDGPGPQLMGADTLLGNDVYNTKDEDLGDIKEIMLDMASGRVAYAVLSFGGILTLGEKLFAVPWDALKLDKKNKRFTLDVDKERLKNAPGFDSGHWPDMADETWSKEVHSFYGTKPYSSEFGSSSH